MPFHLIWCPKHLLLQTSFLTAKELKAHKSLESYNQFVCGRIKVVNTWKKFGKCIITDH